MHFDLEIGLYTYKSGMVMIETVKCEGVTKILRKHSMIRQKRPIDNNECIRSQFAVSISLFYKNNGMKDSYMLK